MATRCQHENSNEIGVFAALTNAYCLTGTSTNLQDLSFMYVIKT